jgi:hypothetical protein
MIDTVCAPAARRGGNEPPQAQISVIRQRSGE